MHSPDAEEKFVKEGHGLNRYEVMYNDFVIVGPSDDPAHIRGARTASEALSRIAEANAVFVSRGDDSGTHKKEETFGKVPEFSHVVVGMSRLIRAWGAFVHSFSKKGLCTD